MTPYGKHTIGPHRSSPSKFRWSNTNLLPVSIHCNAQGEQEAVRSGSWEIPASKVPLSPSSWCVLLPSGSRAGDQLIFAKSLDLPRLPCCHCPRRQMHPLHLYIFPDHGSNYLQVQNKRSRRQLHFAAAEKKKKKSPATIQPAEKGEYIIFFLQESSSCPYRSPYYSPQGQSCSQQQRDVIQQPPQPAVHFPHNKLGNNWRSGLVWQRMLTSENSLQTNLYNGSDVLLEVQFCVQEEVASSKSSDTWFACKQCSSFCKKYPRAWAGRGERQRESCDTVSKLRKPARKPRAGAWKSLNKEQGLGKMPSDLSKPGSPTGLLTGSDSIWEIIISMYFNFLLLCFIFRWGFPFKLDSDTYLWLLLNLAFRYLVQRHRKVSSCSNCRFVGWTAMHFFFSLPFISLKKSTESFCFR